MVQQSDYIGGITSRVRVDEYSINEVEKNVERELSQDYERLRYPRSNNDRGAGLLCVIMPALRIKDWDHAYLETDFEEIGGKE